MRTRAVRSPRDSGAGADRPPGMKRGPGEPEPVDVRDGAEPPAGQRPAHACPEKVPRRPGLTVPKPVRRRLEREGSAVERRIEDGRRADHPRPGDTGMIERRERARLVEYDDSLRADRVGKNA